jgi:hypothetical protein
MRWQTGWLASIAGQRRDLWRGVEAQHRVATMRLADSLEEQELLEQLLEDSKPALPPEGHGLHFLLSTPFRYVSQWPSRFRRSGEGGAWYGADEPATVAAELAHWRWKFFMDSEGLRREQLVAELTFFQARFKGPELDLTQPPWDALRADWRHPEDYAPCQALAAKVRALAPPAAAIRYESARREHGVCQVVFDVKALSVPHPDLQQTWVCKTTATRVLFSHDRQALQFDMPESV